MFEKHHRFLLRYGLGPLILMVALLLKEWAGAVFSAQGPFLLLFVPILISAWHGGPGPALVTTFLAAAASDYFFLPPLHSFGRFDRSALTQFSLFILEGIAISFLAAAMHSSERRVDRTAPSEKANPELQNQIAEKNRTEEQLRKSEHQLAMAQEIASLGSWEWDIRENKVTWSDELYRVYGLKPQSCVMTYEIFLDRVHPDDRSHTQEMIRRALSDQPSFSFSHRIIRPDGAVRTLQARGEVDRGPDGQPIKMIGTGQDITERSVAEEELRRAEDFLNSIVENLPNMIFVKEAQELRFVRFNKAGEALLGYPREDLIGKNDYDFFPKEQADFFVSKDRQVLNEGRLVDIPEEPIQTRHLGMRILHTKKIPLYDKEGKPLYLLGISEDITERKKAEEEREQLVREQTARIEAEAAQERLTFLSEAGALLTSSLEYEAILTRLAELAVPRLADGCTVSIIEKDGSIHPVALSHVDPEKAKRLQELQERYPIDPNQAEGVPEVLRSGRPEIYTEISDANLAGSARDEAHLRMLREIGPRSVMIVPLIIQSRPIGAMTFLSAESGRIYSPKDLALAQDLARRAALAIENARLYRQAQEANHAKDEFLAVVSHELRTPLNAILGWSHIMQGEDLDAETKRRALESISRNATSQAQLIEDLLDVSRIITGKLHMETRQTEVAPILRASIDAVQPAADAKEISITSHLSDPSISVLGDPDRLQQVIWNLISNAIKFTPRQGSVSIDVDRIDPDVQIRVRDTGMGISPDFLPYVFDRFRQADSSSTRTHSGLGLGLAIVRHLVELHGGTVSAESPGKGKGATFTVKLPGRPVRVNEEMRRLSTAMQPGNPGKRPVLRRGLRVLVVDDEADARDLVMTTLRQCQAEVTAVGSVREAMRVFVEARPDILVSDIAMPEEDGYDLIRKIRALAPEQGGNIPALALTAYSRTEDSKKILSAGFQTHLSKPVHPAQLAAAIAKLDERRDTGILLKVE